jgi:hypothetical protein
VLLEYSLCTPGVPRKPGMTRDDLFNINAGIVKNLVTAVAKHCPEVRFSGACDGPGLSHGSIHGLSWQICLHMCAQGLHPVVCGGIQHFILLK